MSIPSNNSIQVSSKHFIDKLESSIIQIARAYALEFSVKVDPDAKQMTREVIQSKINELLSANEKDNIRQVWLETLRIVKQEPKTNWDLDTYARQIYETLKVAGFDNV